MINYDEYNSPTRWQNYKYYESFQVDYHIIT